MTRLLSFGDYQFRDTGVSLSWNFANLVTRTGRLPGVDGGFDEYGDERAPSEIGKIQATMWLKAFTAAEMTAARDAVAGMAAMGVQSLVIEPYRGGAVRSCRARLDAFTHTETYAQFPMQRQRITLNFQAAYPRWGAANADNATVISASGTATNATKTNAGNAVAVPVITLAATTNISASGLKIRRMVGATIADEISYAAALTSGDTLVIDCRDLSIKRNGSDAYSSAVTFSNAGWLRVQPGSNTIRVVLGGGETADVTIAFDDAWV